MPRHIPIRRTDLPELNRYWNDRQHRQQVDAETKHQQRLAHDNLDAALIAAGKRWPADWTDAEKQDATDKWSKKI